MKRYEWRWLFKTFREVLRDEHGRGGCEFSQQLFAKSDRQARRLTEMYP